MGGPRTGAVMMIGLGVVALGLVGYGLLAGEITILWARLGGWTSVSSTASRDDQPILFWGATLFYGFSALGCIGGGLFMLVHPH